MRMQVSTTVTTAGLLAANHSFLLLLLTYCPIYKQCRLVAYPVSTE